MVLKDESLFGSNKEFVPFTFLTTSNPISDKIGIGLNPREQIKNKIQLGKDSGISGSLSIEKGLVVNQRQQNSDTIISGQADKNLLFIDADKDIIGIGTDVLDDESKLTIKGNVYIYDDSSDNLGAEILNDGNFSSSSNWDLAMGGFTIETESIIVNGEEEASGY